MDHGIRDGTHGTGKSNAIVTNGLWNIEEGNIMGDMAGKVIRIVMTEAERDRAYDGV